MCTILVIFTVIFGLSGASPVKYKRNPRIEGTLQEKPVLYDYNYVVEDKKSGLYMSRWEERRGDYARGEYSMLEPGGFIRTVEYQVDGRSGFKAKMSTSLPANRLLSRQQYLKSLELHPQPPLELDPIPPDVPLSDDHRVYNYHAKYHEQLGFQKLFGRLKH